MKREIKFRAWDKDRNVMMNYIPILGISEWFIYGHERKWLHNCMDWDNEDEFSYNFDLMQFTGLTDKNGKEIYEGDVVSDGKIHSRVAWEKYSLWLHHLNVVKTSDPGSGRMPFMFENLYEVIGNIYENPELI